METKKAKVIMLPTDDITNIFIYDNQLFCKPSSDVKFNYVIYQHLYVTTDDKIKEGDWVYENNLSETSIYQVVKRNNRLVFFRFRNVPIYLDKDTNNCKKIIATTDKSLKSKVTFFGKDIKFGYHENTESIYKSLPQISQSFIEEYCKAGGIDEVLVEYVQYYKSWETRFDYTLIPKVDSDNCITIHPIKEKMYSRKEVIDILDDFNSRGGFGDSFRNGEEFDNWIKENL